MTLQASCGYSLEVAEAITYKIDQEGKCLVFSGDLEECRKVKAALWEIKLDSVIEEC